MVIKESRAPQVGPYYIIKDKVIPWTEDFNDIASNGYGAKDSNNDHYRLWKILQRHYPQLQKVDYDYFPRGRVVYKLDSDKFILYADKCIINDPDIIDDIIYTLNLPKSKVEVKDDFHYQCHNCNDNYVDISENYSNK